MNDLVSKILTERKRQEKNFPNQSLPSGTCVGSEEPQVHLKDAKAQEARTKERVAYLVERGELDWVAVFEEEVAEAFAATTEAELRTELIQVAAVTLRWLEDLDRHGAH